METKFDFYDLPLLTIGNVEAGFINGTATIQFHDEREWFIHEIQLHGTQNGPSLEVEYDGHNTTFQDKLYLHIASTLESGKWAIGIEAQISGELADLCDDRRAPQERLIEAVM